MINRSSCGNARTVRSLPTTAARSRTVMLVSTGGGGSAAFGIGTAPLEILVALSPAGELGLHTCFNPSTSACVPPARFTRVATSLVTSNVTQLDFARLSTRVLAT